jgi:hypothetical protein
MALIFASVTSATTTSKASTQSSTKHPQSLTTHASSAATHSSSKHSASSSAKHHSKGTKASAKTASKTHGQRGISEERTRDIQSALIREHYLIGEPTGKMDQSTKEALTKFQADNGWQTKITPDSRALIKLGLGPDHKGLLNPDTASIPSPHELGNGAQPGGGADPQ